jgi:hypothetical protein
MKAKELKWTPATTFDLGNLLGLVANKPTAFVAGAEPNPGKATAFAAVAASRTTFACCRRRRLRKVASAGQGRAGVPVHYSTRVTFLTRCVDPVSSRRK